MPLPLSPQDPHRPAHDAGVAALHLIADAIDTYPRSQAEPDIRDRLLLVAERLRERADSGEGAWIAAHDAAEAMTRLRQAVADLEEAC